MLRLINKWAESKVIVKRLDFADILKRPVRTALVYKNLSDIYWAKYALKYIECIFIEFM